MRYTSKKAVEYDLEQHYRLQKQYLDKCDELSGTDGFLIKEKKTRSGKLFYFIKPANIIQVQIFEFVGRFFLL